MQLLFHWCRRRDANIFNGLESNSIANELSKVCDAQRTCCYFIVNSVIPLCVINFLGMWSSLILCASGISTYSLSVGRMKKKIQCFRCGWGWLAQGWRWGYLLPQQLPGRILTLLSLLSPIHALPQLLLSISASKKNHPTCPIVYVQEQ